MKKKKNEARPVLTRDAVKKALALLPVPATKRDLARALGVTGGERIALKRIMRELEEEGALERGPKRAFRAAGELPEVLPMEIVDRDPAGEMLASPIDWHGEGPAPRIVTEPPRDRAIRALGIGDRFLGRLRKDKDGQVASVIKELGQSAHRVLGVIQIEQGQAIVAPVDRRTKQFFVLDRAGAQKVARGDIVLVEPLAGRDRGRLRARLRETHGNLDAPGAISLISIHEHGIPVDFPEAVTREAVEVSRGALSLSGREDLRAVPLITIDPEDARDHDDAVYAEPDTDAGNPGGHVVYVAIADVAHYVRPGSALDREAAKRGNSTYFPDRVVPMLPHELSSDKCSLREGEERACLVVRMVIDAQGRKRHHRFVRGLMRSAARLTYAEVEDAITGKPGPRVAPLMARIITPLLAAYRAMEKARDAREPLAIHVPEFRARLGEDGKVFSIDQRPSLEAMKLIEEMMIAANVAAAETLEKAKIPLLYRVHEPPSDEKISAYADYLSSVGLKFAKGQVIKPAAFNRLLARVAGAEHEAALNELTLRTQSQARYSPESLGHFGLNLARYAHFTSPIRRYADLVVHRGLIRALNLGSDGQSDGLSDGEAAALEATAEHISTTERRSMAAERDSIDRYLAAYMQDRIGAEFDGRITGVARFGLFVKLEGLGADGLVPISSLGTDFFQHMEKQHALMGKRTRKTYRLGDRVRVMVAEAAPLHGGLRLQLVDATRAVVRTPGPKHRGR